MIPDIKLKEQESVLRFACEPLDEVRIGYIGLGVRAKRALERMMNIEGARVTALCDFVQENIDVANDIVHRYGGKTPAAFSGGYGWRSLCESEEVDLVYICTDWMSHAEIAFYAMECGKHVAVEVPAAMSISDCWRLVDAAEKYRRHCIMLENCCYDDFELATLNMIKEGVLGEIVHAEGSYIHDLRKRISTNDSGGRLWTNWQVEYMNRHVGNPYPTHGLGPIALAMGIHRGDRMKSLVSLSSHSVSSNSVSGVEFSGTMNSALITTEKNKTILIQCCMTLPRPYSRSYMISGTKGYVQKYPVHSMSFAPDSDNIFIGEQCDSIIGRHRHPFVEKYAKRGKELCGKRWIDFAMDERLIYCLRNGLPLDMDVYDAAEWSSLVELTEQSALAGGAPVEIPDFTRGRWDVLKGVEFAE